MYKYMYRIQLLYFGVKVLFCNRNHSLSLIKNGKGSISPYGYLESNLMPRRLMMGRQGSLSGWESRYNSVARMTKSSINATRVKNEHENNKLSYSLRRLSNIREKAEMTSNRHLSYTKTEFVRILADKQVYKKHRFAVYDPYLKERRTPRTVVFDSIRQYWKQRQEKGKTFTELETIPEEKSRQVSSVSRLHGGDIGPRYRDLPPHSSPEPRRISIAGSYVIEANGSMTSPPTQRAASATSSRFAESIRSDPLAVKEYEYKRVRRKTKSFVMSRDRTIFPGECKSTYEMRKFMDQEAQHFIYLFTPEGRRKTQIDELKKRAEMPQFIDRSRTMSAIFRDFKSYKEQRDSLSNQTTCCN